MPRNLHVAVVDDDALILLLAGRILQRAGIAVTTFTCADDAWQALATPGNPGTRGAFDVVITDVDMPGDMDGIRLARRLALERPYLRVVVMSASRDALRRAHEAGACAVLEKPFTAASLIEVVRPPGRVDIIPTR